MTLRIFELRGTSPRGWGEQHGETFRDDVRALYAVRLRLMLQKTDLRSEDNVLALAAHHLPALERFDRALYDELCGVADGAGLTPAHLVVVNHYTDLRDLSLQTLGSLRENKTDPGGCSAWFVADDNVRLLGQTWDMHGSATPFALLLLVPNDRGQRSAVFTVTGCLGMTGMTSWGTALSINNLNSIDATIGVVWPATVRRALREPDARSQLAVLQAAPIGSGRHYLVADKERAFGMETSGTRKKVIFETDPGAHTPSYFHTNHCVDEEMKPTAKILAGSTTVQRYATLKARTDAGRVPQTARAMFDAFADVALPHNPAVVDDVATCGALVMDLKAGSVIACQGLPGPHTPVIELKP